LTAWRSLLRFNTRKVNEARSAWQVLGVSNFEVTLDDLARLSPELYGEAAAFSPPW
jgi:hypothetical protein